MFLKFYNESAWLSQLAFSGKEVPLAYNPLIQKENTYNILSNTYAEKKAKYDNATPEYQATKEYARLGAIVSHLRVTLKQMEEYMGR